MLPPVGTQSLNHWTTREVPRLFYFKKIKTLQLELQSALITSPYSLTFLFRNTAELRQASRCPDSQCSPPTQGARGFKDQVSVVENPTASIFLYNAMPMEGVDALIAYMKEFEVQHHV